jgi:cytochrome c-type biogenesis protein CcmH/NrfG
VLLDRKKVRFWQKIVFSFMAVLMAGFLVFGYSGVLSSCQESGGALSPTKRLDDEIASLRTSLDARPDDAQLWRRLGEAYLTRSANRAESQGREDDLRAAAAAFERRAELLGEEGGAEARRARRDALETLASVYLQLDDAQATLDVYGQLTSLAPKRAEYFYDMGTIALSAGDTDRALLAFNRYLELDPDSPDAESVRTWVEENTPDDQGSQ